MSNVMLKAVINTRVYVASWTAATLAAMKERRDEGQGAVEYVGVIVLVALIIAAIVGSGVANDIATGLKNKVTEILGGGGGAGGGGGGGN
ncbi:hypothetical protein ACFYW6_18705 [Streptomyces sp. NPDC002659]|uniref:hypothetical protein n=1 Tax=Streptomyces sp. NPDC002659 TaxID=3364656 RepID=UPI0036CAB69F